MFGWGTQIAVQLPTVIKKGFKYKFSIDFKDEGIKKIVKLALPILISTWVQPINNIVNIRFAKDNISVIEYAYNLYLIIVGVFSYTLSNIIFPELSKLTADAENDKVANILNKSIKISLFFIIPMSIGIMIFSNDIIKVLYERGEFTSTSTFLTGRALFYYAIGMIGYGMMEILNKAFYAMQDSKTPMKISAVAIAINVVLSIVLVKRFDYVGLPLAASITSIIIGMLMLAVINKKMKNVIDDNMIKELLRIIVAAIGMAAVVILLKDLIKLPTIFVITVSVLIGVVVYFLIMFLLKSEIVKEAKNLKKLV